MERDTCLLQQSQRVGFGPRLQRVADRESRLQNRSREDKIRLELGSDASHDGLGLISCSKFNR